MFEHERVLNEFTLAYFASVVQDIDESEMDRIPAPGMNSPRWILGHLAVNADYGLRMFGQRFYCPIPWHRSFARGSQAAVQLEPMPSKEELIAKINEGFAELRQLSSAADPTAMAQPHSVPFLADTALKTVGEVLAHLLTTHLAVHVGQLSYWRRAAGRERVVSGPL